MQDMYIASPTNTVLVPLTRIPDQCTGGMPFTTAILDCASADANIRGLAYELREWLDMAEVYEAFFGDKVNGDARLVDSVRMNLYACVMETSNMDDTHLQGYVWVVLEIYNNLINLLMTYYAWRLPAGYIAQPLLEFYDVSWISPGTVAVRYICWGKNEGFNHN